MSKVDAINFGSEPRYYGSFVIRVMLLFIPAVIIGKAIDMNIKHLQAKEWLGKSVVPYLLLQLFINATVFYLAHTFLKSYSSEFLSTLAGVYFTTFFFTVQYNFETNLEALGLFNFKDI